MKIVDARPGADAAERSARRQWDELTTLYRPGPEPGANRRTEQARATAVRGDRDCPMVELFVDPACPYTWLVTQWLKEVAALRPIDLHLRLMSLGMLNEGRSLSPRYREIVAATWGPTRVGTAVLTGHGEDAFRAWHQAFGELVFDYWQPPDETDWAAAIEQALRTTALPVGLASVATTDEFDAILRASHQAGIAPVGIDAGTPVIHMDGMAFFGPVLNRIPRGADALKVFDGVRLLAGFDHFFELKRTRTSPPEFT